MQLFMRVLVSQILDNKSGECKVSQPQPQYDILDVKKPHAAPCHVLYLLWHSSVINFALLSSLPLLSSPCLLACMLARSYPRTRRHCTPVPAQGCARWKRRCTMRTLTSMRTCPRPSWPLALLPSLPLLLLPLPPPLTVTTKPLFLKSLLSSSLLMLKLKTLLRWLTPCTLTLAVFRIHSVILYLSSRHGATISSNCSFVSWRKVELVW